MTESKYDMMQKVSQEALLDPRPGDYWSDHFCPVLIVLTVKDGMVHTCSKRVDVGNNEWSLDITEQIVYTLDEFKGYLSYSAEVLPNKPWAECARYAEGSARYQFVEEAEMLSENEVVSIRYVPKCVHGATTKEFSSRLTTNVGDLIAGVQEMLDAQNVSFTTPLTMERTKLIGLLQKVQFFLKSKESGPRTISADILEIHLSPKTDKELGAYQCYTETLKTAQLLGPLDSNKEQQLHAITAGYIATLKKLRESEDKIKPT